jgi:predicted nucleotide-binding protein (sugar kinase/HSP70/actin superfamily)
MKIMLAYYNDLTVFLSTVFRALDFKIDYMGRPAKKTIELATKYATESWCFDTKMMLGQAIEGFQRGNEILTMPGAWGGKNENCLLGYLCQGPMKKRIEQAVHKKVKLWFFNVNPIEMMFSGYSAAYKNIAMLKPYTKVRFFRTKVLKAMVLGVKKMRLAAKLKERVLDSAEVVDKEVLFAMYDMFIKEMIFNADDSEKAKKIFENANRGISGLKRKKIKKKITIGIVGDYAHTLFSIFPFFDIEKFLILEDVNVRQPLSFINYYSIISPIYSKRNRQEVSKIFPKAVTGSDAITILSANYLRNKVDGLIHVGTFSCTPEEVANEVLLLHKKMFPPILSLSYDAHTTEENLKVRIEAFVDMLLAKKR